MNKSNFEKPKYEQQLDLEPKPKLNSSSQTIAKPTVSGSLLSKLKVGDYIAFEWQHGIFGKEIIVDNITSVQNNEVLVHFVYGYKSEGEYIKKKDIIAIGDLSASGKIKGWSGNFNILLPNHELLSDCG